MKKTVIFAAETVETCMDDFLTHCKAKGLKEKTVDTYGHHFSAIGKHLDLQMPIDALTKRHIEKAMVEMRDCGLSPNSICSYSRTLKSFFSWCNAEGLSQVQVDLYKEEERPKETYTDAELKRLLKKPERKGLTFTTYRNWVIVNLLLNAGCRAATIRNIKVADIDLEHKAIMYRHNKNRNIQLCPLCDEMAKILKGYIKAVDLAEDDYLFPAEDETMLTEGGLRKAIVSYNHSRGVSKTSIHLFRHTFAQRFIQNGGDAFTLQKILGHSTLDMTKHYCRIYDYTTVQNFNRFSPLATLK